jgi:hypothetical protein
VLDDPGRADAVIDYRVAEPACEPAPRERGPRRGQLGCEVTGERDGDLVLEVGHQSVVSSSG